MAQEPDHLHTAVEAAVPNKDPEEIRGEIDHTRSSLTQKLETLEGKVMGTVESAQQTVHQTVESVKQTVENTVQSVKRTFDLQYQWQRHPWFLFGASVAAGFTVAQLIGLSGSERSRRRLTAMHSDGSARRSVSAGLAASVAPSAPRDERPSEGVISRLAHQFSDEIHMVQGAAVGALMGLVRDWLKQSMPGLSHQLEDVANRVTRKLGGEPVHGPVFQSTGSSASV